MAETRILQRIVRDLDKSVMVKQQLKDSISRTPVMQINLKLTHQKWVLDWQCQTEKSSTTLPVWFFVWDTRMCYIAWKHLNDSYRFQPLYDPGLKGRGHIAFRLLVFLGHRSQRLQWPIVIMRCPASVVRRPSSVRLFTFSTSSPEPLDGFWWNLVWMKYSRSLTSVVVFRPDPSRGGSRAGQK